MTESQNKPAAANKLDSTNDDLPGMWESADFSGGETDMTRTIREAMSDIKLLQEKAMVVTPKASAVPESIDTAELSTELERQWLAKTIDELADHAQRHLEIGEFRTGWETVLEEIKARCAAPSAPQAEDKE